MKKAVVIIRLQAYKKTKAALEKTGFSSFSVTSVLGRGKNPVSFSAADSSTNSVKKENHPFVAKKMLLVFIHDEDEERFVQAVSEANKTGNPGDGKIFIVPVRQGIRIRTGEHGDDSIY
ncbi:MAG: P-II family nitrogen regulator [Ethanoligenens sp.]